MSSFRGNRGDRGGAPRTEGGKVPATTSAFATFSALATFSAIGAVASFASEATTATSVTSGTSLLSSDLVKDVVVSIEESWHESSLRP